MTTHQMSLSVKNQSETAFYRDLTEQEQEKLGGGFDPVHFLFTYMVFNYVLNNSRSQPSQSTTKSGSFNEVFATDQENHGWFMSQDWILG